MSSDAPYEIHDYEYDGETIGLFLPSYFTAPDTITLKDETGQDVIFERTRKVG